MWECPYAKEPFDTKLFVLLFMKKIWVVIGGMLLGTVLIGGGYYIKNVVFGGPTEYDITTTYYVQYNNYDPVTGEMHNYTNAATWQTWVTSDHFVDKTWDYALEAGLQPDKYGVTKSDLKGYFTADLPSDLRIPTSTVTTPYEELTSILNTALQKVYQDFGKERVEMESIIITDETPLQVADKDIRTFRAVVLGAVMGLVVAGFGLSLWILWDDSVIIPETFTYRYGIPMAGFLGKGDTAFTKETILNIKHLLGKEANGSAVLVGSPADDKVQTAMKEAGIKDIVAEAELSEEYYEKLRREQKVILLVEAGARNGKQMEHVLLNLKLQDCNVVGALLLQGDSQLIKVYRMGRKGNQESVS